MAIRPSLKRAVPETLNKASDYNDNFDLMMDFVDASVLESKNYIEGYIPPVTGQSGKFMTNNGTVAGWESLPDETGFIKWYSGASIPDGYLLCDGSAISRDTYAKLFSVIGTTYGAGDSNTTFNLPNLIDKFIYGSSVAGSSVSETTTATGTESATHQHSYVAGQDAGLYTAGETALHTHIYTKGVNGVGLLPIIRYQ